MSSARKLRRFAKRRSAITTPVDTSNLVAMQQVRQAAHSRVFASQRESDRMRVAAEAEWQASNREYIDNAARKREGT